MSRKKILGFLVLLGVLITGLWLYCGTFQLKNPEYLLWVYFGGECPEAYYEKYIFADFYRSRIIQGLSTAEIRKRFPGIVDGETFPKESYRGTLLQNWRAHDDYKSRDLKLFWFDNAPDKMGWAIIILNDKGYQIYPMKG